MAIRSYTTMRDTSSTSTTVSNDLYLDAYAVPEEPFGISKTYWIAGLICFTTLLIVATILFLMKGGMPHLIGGFYAIPAILFAYFYRRRGVLVVYLLAMFFFAIVVVFRYPSVDDIFAAAVSAVLLIAIALTVSYLTHPLVQEKRKYHAIFENTENGVVLLNIPDRKILEMNKRFALSVGLSGSDTKGRNLNDFIPDPALRHSKLFALHNSKLFALHNSKLFAYQNALCLGISFKTGNVCHLLLPLHSVDFSF